MAKKIEIGVPKPCGEKFSDFAPTSVGGFCGSCRKEVIDFTSWSDDRLKAYFKSEPQHGCGRFRDDQLKVYTYEQQRSSAVQWLLAALTGLTLMASREVVAQTLQPKAVVEQQQPKMKLGEVIAKVDSLIFINGKVTSAGDSSFLGDVNVFYKGNVVATTDSLGKFSFTLPKTDSVRTLIFYSREFGRARHIIRPGVPHENIAIVLRGVVTHSLTTGAICYLNPNPPWYSPRRWWYGVKGWFGR